MLRLLSIVDEYVRKYSSKIYLVVLAFLINMASVFILFKLEDRFTFLTRETVFDTQNDLTQQLILKQLPLYDGIAKAAYWQFLAFDFVFPLVAGLFLVILWSNLIFRRKNIIFEKLKRYKLYWFPILTTIFDYFENLSYILILNGTPNPMDSALTMAILFKKLKLLTLNVSFIISLVLIAVSMLYGIIAFVNRKSKVN